ncbi:hypothetical protein PH5382_03819 [Phaeobacter sp. CECT 5382]|uniref:DUF6880 family protein n=1 Tax=Phaeobacter sp. CECT 5382 TaxID=1712645 RepID=UPI0006DA977C|nr:DUF6880 family protein [Phaeobacter sp. CECT 5382]CUH89866.1 hypothetical protein PH5382_03819 [Phaeobacter sp. CECT 5382]
MSKKTLNQTNLEALGADKLAALLMEVSTGSAEIKRRLRLELSHSLGASELAREVRKRLLSLRKSTSFVSWRKRKTLIKDLDTQVTMIVEKIAPEDPATAFDLLWQFIEPAPSVYERVDDSRGDVGNVFRAATKHFEDIAPHALIDPVVLAERVWTVVQDNGYGEWDGIIPLMAPTLGASGLARLKADVEVYAAAPIEEDPADHEAIQFLRQLRGGDTYAADRKSRFVKWCLQEIAATAGDTSAYIDQYTEEDLKRKDISAEVAGLLLSDDQAAAALDLLLAADQEEGSFGQEAWDDAYIASLAALGRPQEAQKHRWACFSSTLSTQHLRDYLTALPDFEDVEAEDLAKTLVLAFPDFSVALGFCVNWPDPLTAAQLIEDRASEIDGNHYMLLSSAAETLRSRHPRAAVLLWRAMIDYTLEQGRSKHYGHAAEHLADCALLDAEILDYGAFPNHDTYVKTLQDHHDRKSSFWAKVR